MTQIKVISWYHDGDDLIVVAEDGTKHRLVNPWLSSVTWHGLESEATDLAIIENTQRYG